MKQVDLAFTSALEQARMVQNKTVSPLELVELYLERIQQFNPDLGSYFTVTADLALADAAAKTEILATHATELPPFFGVPISIKDLHPVADVRCTYGTRALLDNIATYDDGVVTKIKQAGFIILGKTATSELGALPYSEPEGFPPARNPWNLDYTPGGSSGGAAAAVAAGLCAIAHSSDGGGSIRGPAFCCGVVGIKPSRGRVSNAPVGEYSGLGTHGPLARTVADAAALLDVMSGYVIGDPYWLPDPEVPFLAATQQAPGPLRVAFSTSVPPIGEADPLCQQAVLKAVNLLEAWGHHVEPGCPDFTALVNPFVTVWRAGVSASSVPLEHLGKMSRWLSQQAGSSSEYLRAVAAMHRISREIVAFFDSIDVLVLPTYLSPPIRIGEWANLSPEETLKAIIQWIAPAPPFNATGQPAISLPLGFSPAGLPIGVQLVGRPAAEATLIALAAEIERASPWGDRRPASVL